ncbi:hypothetical protein OIO90_001436 [Microbotryomycetes sp. JL221]|nr:hypothetical protein OIO90_001436 [Microbotryomycetes sp. JL221]
MAALDDRSAATASSSSSKTASMTMFKATLSSHLATLTREIVERRHQQPSADDAMDEQALMTMVDNMIKHSLDTNTNNIDDDEPQWVKDSRRTIVDGLLEQMALAQNPQPTSDDQTVAFAILGDVLDVVLTFAEQGYAEDTCPLNIVTILMDQQTVDGCVHLFKWIESRVDRVTKGMQPLRGKGPILLRLSNELLRRLPKTKQQHVVFSGQVLMFLNQVFPLGEKSGVNLRGNFNSSKVTLFDHEQDYSSSHVDSKDTTDVSKPDFYQAFWSLQQIFSNPTLLFEAQTSSTSLKQLELGIKQTLEVFGEATKQERKLAGNSKAGKRKATNATLDDDVESSLQDYFFPRYLTSRNLLELEIADVNFRRQVLFQTLILFQYMLSFVPQERERLKQRTTNQSALPNYTLETQDERWVREFKTKISNELDSMEGGKRFRQTVDLILRREQNWINWKLKSCFSFEKPPLEIEKLSNNARIKLKALGRKPKSFMFALGNASLSKTWQKNTTSLDEFEPEPIDDDFDRLVRDWRMTTKAKQMRQKALEQTKIDNPSSSKVFEFETEIEQSLTLVSKLQLDIKSQAIQWRAVRSLAKSNLAILNKAGSSSLDKILNTIEQQAKIKAEKEQQQQQQQQQQLVNNDTNQETAGMGNETLNDKAGSGNGEMDQDATQGASELAQVTEDNARVHADRQEETSVIVDEANELDSVDRSNVTSPVGKRKHDETVHDDVEMAEGGSDVKKFKVDDEA